MSVSDYYALHNAHHNDWVSSALVILGVTFAVGDKVYWDDGNDFAVATDGAGANKLLGKAVAAAADADTSVLVRLSQ